MVRQKTDLRIHEEISVLQKKLSETDIQLTEEKKTKLRLTNEANTKVKELNGILEAIQDEETSFQRDVKAIQHDTNMIIEKNKQRIKDLNKRKSDLQHHISAMDTLQDENSYLRKHIIELTRDYDRTVMAQEEEREKIKQRNFDARMTMEAVLRKEIQTVDTNFKVLAIQSMNDEAMMASNENKGLYAELSKREDLSRSMIAEQQASYEELQRITIEHEVMITAADYYENIIKELTRVVAIQDRKEKKLEQETKKIKERVETYETISAEKLAQASKILALFTKYNEVKEKNRKYRLECIKKCQKALKLSIKRAIEQQTEGSQQLTKDDEALQKIREEEEAAAKAELLNINAMLTKTSTPPSIPTSTMSTEDHQDTPCEDYEAMWQSSKVKFPQLTGTIRNAVLREAKHKNSYSFGKKRFLLPKGVSTSMTNHV